MSIYCQWLKEISLVKLRSKPEPKLSDMTLEEMKVYVQYLRSKRRQYY